jgi:hypothetical protein
MLRESRSHQSQKIIKFYRGEEAKTSEAPSCGWMAGSLGRDRHHHHRLEKALHLDNLLSGRSHGFSFL